MTNTTFPASSPVFDLLEALSERFPTIRGCYARYTGGVHWEPIIAVVKSPTIPAGMVAWNGGDSAPEDWNPRGKAMFRDGEIVDCEEGGEPDWGHVWGSADIIAYTPLAAAPKQAEQQGVEPSEAQIDAWNDFAGEYLTDGKGHAVAAVWDRCRAAFDAAWPVGAEAALHRALAALNAPTGAVEKGEAK